MQGGNDMRPGFSAQYKAGVVIIEEKDLPLDGDYLIDMAHEYEAFTFDKEAKDNDDLLFVVRFPDGPDEVYTESALRRSVGNRKKHPRR